MINTWEIRYFENGSEQKVEYTFSSKKEARDYINMHLKGKNAEILEAFTSRMNPDEFRGKWLYLYSFNTNTFLSYGKVLDVKKSYIIFQTKENANWKETSEIRVCTILRKIHKNQAYFSDNGIYNNPRVF